MAMESVDSHYARARDIEKLTESMRTSLSDAIVSLLQSRDEHQAGAKLSAATAPAVAGVGTGVNATSGDCTIA